MLNLGTGWTGRGRGDPSVTLNYGDIVFAVCSTTVYVCNNSLSILLKPTTYKMRSGRRGSTGCSVAHKGAVWLN
jgi:hypothetical protein